MQIGSADANAFDFDDGLPGCACGNGISRYSKLPGAYK
jgi:hypothetical protein